MQTKFLDQAGRLKGKRKEDFELIDKLWSEIKNPDAYALTNMLKIYRDDKEGMEQLYNSIEKKDKVLITAFVLYTEDQPEEIINKLKYLYAAAKIQDSQVFSCFKALIYH